MCVAAFFSRIKLHVSGRSFYYIPCLKQQLLIKSPPISFSSKKSLVPSLDTNPRPCLFLNRTSPHDVT
jgi:hypothetical protein